jgi:transcriptional regulator with XRE-family HTH domain
VRGADEIHERDMQDPAYRREYERTRLANDIAAKVIQYRADHRLSQTSLGQLVGMSQPNVARLEAGEHLPSLDTLSRLALGLGLDFSVDVKPDRMALRQAARRMKTTRTSTAARDH